VTIDGVIVAGPLSTGASPQAMLGLVERIAQKSDSLILLFRHTALSTQNIFAFWSSLRDEGPVVGLEIQKRKCFWKEFFSSAK